MPQIFESPDGGKTVYTREMGSRVRKLHSVSPSAVEEIKETQERLEWNEIRHLAKDNPALQKAVDHVKLLYQIIKNGNSKT
jgi:hypothetical protein